MKRTYRHFAPDEPIPVAPLLNRKKLFKYYTRETMAAVLTVTEFLQEEDIRSTTPFYYASAENENYDFFRSAFNRMSAGYEGYFDAALYQAAAPPTAQFKIMRNMVLCLVSIEKGLTGDNNVIVDSASALLYAALTAPGGGPVLIGAGFLHADDSVEVGFALANPDEFVGHPLLGSSRSAIDIFKP